MYELKKPVNPERKMRKCNLIGYPLFILGFASLLFVPSVILYGSIATLSGVGLIATADGLGNRYKGKLEKYRSAISSRQF